jgi:hypothetical protein
MASPTPKLLFKIICPSPDSQSPASAHLEPTAAAPWLSRLILASMLASVSVLGGIAPQLSWRSPAWEISLTNTVRAQSDDLITRYARAAYEMEQFRRRDYAEVKRIMGGIVPEELCDRGNISSQVQAICGRFSDRFDPILRKYGLSRAEFNSVHRRANDPAIQQRIQQELLRIQSR